MHFGCMSAILLYNDHRHVLATHIPIFRVVGARIQIYLHIVWSDHFTVKIIWFWLKLHLIGKIVLSMKYLKLKTGLFNKFYIFL